MARIPGAEGLGEVVARPQRFNETQTPRNAFGEGVGRTLSAIGGDMLDQQARQQAQERALADAERKAANKAQALATLQRAQDDLLTLGDEIGEGILTGQIDKTKAGQEWGTRAKERITASLEGVPAEHRAAIQADLEHRMATLGRTTIGKAIRTRDREDVKSGISQTMEYAQRLYRTDPKAAEELVAGTLEQLGPFAGLGAGDVAKAKQAWREGSQYTKGFEAVSAARNDRKGLDAAEKLIGGLSDLDPQRRAVLIDRVSNYRLALDQKAEIAAARAQRHAEAALKRAEGVFTAASSLADKGVLSPQYADQVLGQLAGTPFQPAFRQLVEAQYTAGPLAAKPIAVQRAELDAVNTAIAQNGLTPTLEKRRAQVEKVVRGSEEDLKRDALRAALERGVIDGIAPLDVSSPQAIAATAAQRMQQAQVVSQWAGGPVSPLTDQEAVSVKSLLDTLPVKERSTAVATLAQALGPQASAGLARQMDAKDKALALALGMAGAQTTQGRYTSELVLRGAQAQKDGTSTKNEKAAAVKPAQWSRALATELEGVFPVQTLTDNTRDAALLIAHGIAAEQGGELSERDLKRAVGLAVGGNIVEYNGRRIPLPAGVDEDALRKRLGSVTVEEIARQAFVPRADGQPQDLSKLTVRAGGVAVPVAEFVRSLPGQELVYAGPGRYSVLVQGRPVVNAEGRRIVVGVQ